MNANYVLEKVRDQLCNNGTSSTSFTTCTLGDKRLRVSGYTKSTLQAVKFYSIASYVKFLLATAGNFMMCVSSDRSRSEDGMMTINVRISWKQREEQKAKQCQHGA